MPTFLKKSCNWPICFLISIACWSMYAAAQTSDENSLKAALTYNFAKYTQWPEAILNDNIEICFFNTALQNSFAPLSGKSAQSYIISIKHISEITDSDSCQLVFIDRTNRNLLNRLNVHLEQKPVLTVSDINGFVDDGGMIEIQTIDNRLRFNVNLPRVQSAGIVLNSQLLNLAVEVKR